MISLSIDSTVVPYDNTRTGISSSGAGGTAEEEARVCRHSIAINSSVCRVFQLMPVVS